MHETLIAWLSIGFILGLLGKLIFRQDGPRGWVIDLWMGMAGAFIGGFFVQVVFGISDPDAELWEGDHVVQKDYILSLLGSVGGSLLVLFLTRFLHSKRTR